MNGYIVTTESDDAPSRMLTDSCQTSACENYINCMLPIPVQLGQNRQPRTQLQPKEPNSLRNRHVSVRHRTRFSSFYNPKSTTTISKDQSPKTARMYAGKIGKGVPTPLSKFRSHISLIVHPAPRMTNAPIPNKVRYVKGVVMGRCNAVEAIVIDQATANPVRHDSESRFLEKGTHCTGSTTGGCQLVCQPSQGRDTV